jgi:hypothetical protein
MKNKGYTKQYRNDDPTTYLTNEDQQKNMLLDMIDDEVEKKVKEKKINKYVEPQIDESINQITASRVRLETRRRQRRADPPEIFEKNNSGLVGILGVSKRIKE